MRAQLSFEFLAYMALGLLAIGIAVREAQPLLSQARSEIEKYQAEEFVSKLDEALINGTDAFYAYIPYQICNATVSNSMLLLGNLTLPLLANASLSALCPNSGRYAVVRLAYQNGTIRVS